MPFDIGFFELLLIVIIALVVLGPERLPKAMHTVGRWVGKAKRGVSQFNQQVSRELELEEMKKRIAEHEKIIMEQAETDEELKRLREEAQATIAKAQQALKETQKTAQQQTPHQQPSAGKSDPSDS